jgi:hypothetical protein
MADRLAQAFVRFIGVDRISAEADFRLDEKHEAGNRRCPR